MRVLLMGRKRACANTLEYLVEHGHQVVGVVTDSHLDRSATAATAAELNVPLLSHEDVEAGLEQGTLGYDVGLSVVYWRKIPLSMIEAASRGIVNFHPAPLPDYKGTGGYNLAILEGRSDWAVTAHYIDEHIDTGRIIGLDWFAIDPQTETAQTLERRSMARIEDMAKEVLGRIAQSTELLPTQPNEGGRYVSRSEMEAMKFVEPGDDVSRKIRAFWFPPYSGATVVIGDSRYTLVNDEILRSIDPEASRNPVSTGTSVT